MSAETPEIPKLFVGYSQMYVVDGDGIPRKTVGSHIYSTLHRYECSNGDFTFVARLPPSDPIRHLKLNCETNEFLMVSLWVGPFPKADEHCNPNRNLIHVEVKNCKELSDELDNSSDRSAQMKAYMPMIKDAYSRPVYIKLSCATHKFANKVGSLTVTIPKEMYEEWNMYIENLKKFDKDEKDKKEDKDSKDKE